jgi:methyl-accepting chemotaxis protein
MFAKLKSLGISHKLVVIFFLMALPIGVLLSLFVSNLGSRVIATRNEQKGLAYIRELRHLADHLSLHQGAANAALQGADGFRAQLTALQSRIDADLTTLEALDQKDGEVLKTTEGLKRLKNTWQELRMQVLTWPAAEGFERQARLIAETNALARQAADQSTMTTDSELDAHYLGDALAVQLAAAAEASGQLRSYGTGLAARVKRTPAELAQLTYLTRQTDVAGERVTVTISKAIEHNPLLEPRLAKPLAAATAAVRSFSQYAGQELSDPQAFFDKGSAAVDAYSGLQEQTAAALGDILTARLDRLDLDRMIQVGLTLGLLGLAGLAVYRISRGIARQVRAIDGLLVNIGMGDFAARAEVMTTDELGTTAHALNAMLDNTVNLLQSQEERDNMQSSILKLLDDVAGVAHGDLTKEAEVTAEMTGAIADSFNYMIVELRGIIGSVQETTSRVASSTRTIKATAERLAEGSVQQSQRVTEVSAAIGTMTDSIQQVAQTATTASSVATQALAAARGGNESVQKTVEGMDAIRTHVQETAKRIKRLGESSQEIGEIVQLIEDVADRTSILALNASIQAAMAGEAGKGFAVVAEEVERLAERATGSAKKISTLIKSIQTDTKEAISSMEETTREVVGGSSLASAAGSRLVEIESVSQKLAVLIESISAASRQQALGSEAVTRNVALISGVAVETANGARSASESIQSLAEQAEQLRSSLRHFKLPEDGKRPAADRDMVAA